jgi:hypothetical protein
VEFEIFLSSNAYGDVSLAPYLRLFKKKDDSDMELLSCCWIRQTMIEPWRNWAREIQDTHFLPFERRVAIREMLGGLIMVKNSHKLTHIKLHEVAEMTLRWTSMDKKRSADLRKMTPEQRTKFETYLADQEKSETGSH